MIQWKDETTYSRYVTVRIPSIFRAQVGKICVTVHRHRAFPAEVWLLSTSPAIFDLHQLAAKDLAAAQKESLDMIAQFAMDTLDAIEDAESK